MPHTLDQLLPSLIAFGSWTYWVLALCAMLEAIVLTGALVPGAVAVIAGGMLAQRGVIDILDLMWFVAAGSVIGSEISFRLGRLALVGRSQRLAGRASRHAGAAADLLLRYGGFAMVAGRFLGPLSAFVPFSASMAGMPHRRFVLWNIASAAIYAPALVALGYFSGSALGTLGAAAPRLLAFGAVVIAVLAVLAFTWWQARKYGAALIEIAQTAGLGLLHKPALRALLDRHPRWAGFFAARLGTDQFLGLTTTVLGALGLYVAIAYADSVYDFVGGGATVSTDARVANLFYAMRDDRLIAVLGWITQVGGRHGVMPLLAGATLALLAVRRFDLLGGLWIAAIGNQITVTLLKSLFARPRSDLGYFVETSGSFPSGHAAGAVAVWAMLFYLGWRLRVMRADVAVVGAVVVAGLIGLSRVYLVEHYVSDVLNGYLVGGAWLIIGIAFCEWRRMVPHPAATVPRHKIAALCMAAAVGVAFYLGATTVSPLNPPISRTADMTTTPQTLFRDAGLPAMTEILSGTPRHPINLIVTAPGMAAVTPVLTAAGWQIAPRPALGVLALAFFDDWTGRALPQPLVIPTFWNNRPTALAFARPAAGGDLRLHLRLWDSLTRTPDGAVILVATLTEEDPLDWVADDSARAVPGRAVPATLGQLAQRLTAAGLGVTRP